METNRPEVSAWIISDMEDGKSLRAACKTQGISASTFLRWCDDDAQLAEQYARAKEAGLEVMAEEIQEISDRPAVKYATMHGEQVDSGDVALRRLQVDARKWLLSKMLPKKYGDKLDVTSDGEKLPTVTINVPALPDGNRPQ